MQQLAELGLGHVIKQYISHSYFTSEGRMTDNSRFKVKGYFKLSLLWFLGVSIFIIVFIGLAGQYYFSKVQSGVNWEFPWWMLIFASSVSTLLSPIQFLVDATQHQIKLLKAQVLSALIGAIVLCLSLVNNLELESLALSSLMSCLVLYGYLFNTFKFLYSDLMREKNKIKIGYIFKEIWPLLSRVSIVWGVGYLFWNSFNLIAFQVLDIGFAGKILFMIALARTGFGIAEAILQGQNTIISNLIANKLYHEAKMVFYKYGIISCLILILGYLLFFTVWLLFPEFYFFERLPGLLISVQICGYFFVVFYKTIKNNYVRCFKIEPFIKPAVIESLGIPIIFYLTLSYNPNIAFFCCAIFMIFQLLWTLRIEREFFVTIENKISSINN